MKQQFTIQALTDCAIEYGGTVEYSIDNGNTWNCLDKLSIPAGQGAQFRNAQSMEYDKFKVEGNFNVYGHISTLAPYGSEVFKWLFSNTNIIDASGLILDYDELWPRSYYSMFANCSSLLTAPVLLATTLAEYCYTAMFWDCTSLTDAPELHATTLAQACYGCMFAGCTSLRKAPELPATTLAHSCYASMFARCSGLTKAPELPATELAKQCYYTMFNNCTGLTTAPELPATELAVGCYQGMFYGCTSLTIAPELPAKEMADYCYQNMFKNCNLYRLPKIPRNVWFQACQMIGIDEIKRQISTC